MRCGTIGSRQSAACHFRDCKALLVTSLTHVSGAIIVFRPLSLQLNKARGIGNLFIIVYNKILTFISGGDKDASFLF